MKILFKRSFVLFLITVLLVPVIWNQNNMAALAATTTPAFSETTVTIAGIGETHQMVINNKVAKSKYAWSSTNNVVASVTSKGLITTKASGNTTIKCKITYPTKKTKTLSCKVAVTIPATAIAIADLPLKNNAYQLALGATVDLNATITPANSTDKIYWYVDKDNVLSDPDCISLDANNAGIVTGVKAGKGVVRVKACVNATDTSDIDDSIIIEVVAPTATVSSADITSSNQFTVVFDSPIQQSTVINSDGTLSSNITISLCSDTKKVAAADPGKLTATLSTDLKTLTITSANMLKGIYGINFSNKILTTSNVPVEVYYKQMTYTDTTPPDMAGVTLDETGMIATINFTEPMDFTNFKVDQAKLVNTSLTCNATTLAILNNKLNYIVSQDKKSVSINLSTIVSTDYGKPFTVVFSGLKDLSGNYPANSYLMPIIQTDTAQRPQASPLYVTRTGYYTLTATFDRAIKTPGYLQLSGGTILGVVDKDNNKEVNYTLNAAQATLTGANNVNVYGWNSYNVLSTDTSASGTHNFSVNFTIDNIPPELVSFDYNADTGVLSLTYNEEVSLATVTGTLLAKLTTQVEDVKATNITYTQIADTEPNVIKLQMSNVSVAGYYTFTLPTGFIKDNFLNSSAVRDITITTTATSSSSSTALPAPLVIQQSTTNLSQIFVYFGTKLDKASAETVSNYSIPGVQILSASLSENSASGGVVQLTVADSSITVTVERPMTISGVMGYNGSYTAMQSYTTTITLKENQRPYVASTEFDKTSKNVVKLIFNEEIKGTIAVTVTQNLNGASTVIGNTVLISGNTAYITLAYQPTNGAYLTITPTSNTITDANGNVCTVINAAAVVVTY